MAQIWPTFPTVRWTAIKMMNCARACERRLSRAPIDWLAPPPPPPAEVQNGRLVHRYASLERFGSDQAEPSRAERHRLAQMCARCGPMVASAQTGASDRCAGAALMARPLRRWTRPEAAPIGPQRPADLL